jgi:hypothetical protein
LIYRGEQFGAPIRYNADTVWMREREIATQYRARFDAARNATEVLDKLYEETAAGRDVTERAWLIAVAHPRAATTLITRWSRDETRELLKQAAVHSLSVAPNNAVRPFGSVDWQNPRPGMRRWTAPNKMIGEISRWQEASISLHFDGSVTAAMAVGGHRRAPGFSDDDRKFYEGWRVSELVLEGAVADLMGLVRAVGSKMGTVDCEVRVGIVWEGEERLMFYRRDQYGLDDDSGAVPVHRFIPVDTTVDVRDGDDEGYFQQVQELALDCVNQGGVMYLHLIKDHLAGGRSDSGQTISMVARLGRCPYRPRSPRCFHGRGGDG